jgi:hypothetical protein
VGHVLRGRARRCIGRARLDARERLRLLSAIGNGAVAAAPNAAATVAGRRGGWHETLGMHGALLLAAAGCSRAHRDEPGPLWDSRARLQLLLLLPRLLLPRLLLPRLLLPRLLLRWQLQLLRRQQGAQLLPPLHPRVLKKMRPHWGGCAAGALGRPGCGRAAAAAKPGSHQRLRLLLGHANNGGGRCCCSCAPARAAPTPGPTGKVLPRACPAAADAGATTA